MINKIFSINRNTNSITILGESKSNITKAILYHNEDYINKEGIDISSLFSYNDNEYKADIPSSIIKDTNGVWILELQNSDLDKLKIIEYDFYEYNECILNKLLSLNIEGCIVKEDECNKCSSNILYSHSILESIPVAFNMGMYDEGFKLIKQLKELCSECTNNNTNTNCGCNGK